jgi:pyridinium-3,5-biscarboxylic acid mononucleotide sulfurtransferase
VDLAIGFDLDLTLVDSREGIVATAQAALAEHGGQATEAELSRRIGIPLVDLLAPHLPGRSPEDVEAVAGRYRALYPRLGVSSTRALPGAQAAFAAVRELRGRVVVVSAKPETAIRLVLDHVGLEPDVVVGGLFAADKGPALAEHGVSVYAGDHPGDMSGAHAGGALAVGVPTGPHDGPALRAAGADVVLGSLVELPGWLAEHVLAARLEALRARLGGLTSVLVAFSGGADSAFLLAAAVRALGPDRVLAGTAVSGSLAGGELDGAAAFARDLGVRHLTPTTDELSREGYRANAGDRCFFCKAELLDVLGPLAAEAGAAAVLTGTNADDAVAGFRPGIRAADQRGALAPLRDAGLTKAQVRAASRVWGLPTWDKPAAACLSSRVAYGVPITSAALARVDRAERAVRGWLGEHGIVVRDLRVRDLGADRARIEVDSRCLAALVGPAADGPVAVVLAAGFTACGVDPKGFRSGSMNEVLGADGRGS